MCHVHPIDARRQDSHETLLVYQLNLPAASVVGSVVVVASGAIRGQRFRESRRRTPRRAEVSILNAVRTSAQTPD